MSFCVQHYGRYFFPPGFLVFFSKAIKMILLIFYEFFIYWENFGLLSSFSVEYDSIMLGKIVFINLIQRLGLLQLI